MGQDLVSEDGEFPWTENGGSAAKLNGCFDTSAHTYTLLSMHIFPANM